MARIAFAGFQHETNTFAPTKAAYADFLKPGAWPGLTRGAAIFEAFAGVNVPVAGFFEAARAAGHELVPLAWANATPSAHVTGEAYERIAALLLAALAEALPVDAVYLDLHGAMEIEIDGVHGQRLGEGGEQQGGDALVGLARDMGRRRGVGPSQRDELVARRARRLEKARDRHVDAGEGLEDRRPAREAGPGAGLEEIRVGRLGRGEGVGLVLEAGEGDAGHGLPCSR